MRAPRIGPTVCELEGPMPILKMSNTLMCTRPQVYSTTVTTLALLA